jgi:signal transduction histidine kinase
MLLVVALGLLWLGSRSGVTEGSPISRSLSLATLPLVLPVSRWVLGNAGLGGYVALAGGLLAGPVYSTLYDPLRDATCHQCLRGAFAIHPDIAAATTVALVGNLLVAAGLVLALSRRPAPIALACLGVLPLLGASLWAATAAVVVAALAVLAGVVSRGWSTRQLTELVDGLRDAATFDRAQLAELEARPGLGPHLRLGLEQARLRLTLAEQAAAIDESRRRIVDSADQEARRLERDLHDGAQQHLLGLGMALLGERQTAASAEALRETHACIADLREVAREIYPPVLESGGLGPALAALTGGRLAGLNLPAERFGTPTERTAFLAVADIHNRATRPVTVSGHVEGTELVLEVDGPPPPRQALIHDRVAALGGSVDVQEGRTVVRLPCV